jgi:hypothetical protein
MLFGVMRAYFTTPEMQHGLCRGRVILSFK